MSLRNQRNQVAEREGSVVAFRALYYGFSIAVYTYTLRFSHKQYATAIHPPKMHKRKATLACHITPNQSDDSFCTRVHDCCLTFPLGRSDAAKVAFSTVSSDRSPQSPSAGFGLTPMLSAGISQMATGVSALVPVFTRKRAFVEDMAKGVTIMRLCPSGFEGVKHDFRGCGLLRVVTMVPCSILTA